MLFAAMASAQADETFQFVDADGNVVPDGAIIVVNQVNEENQMVVPLSVQNVSGEKAAVSLYETIDQMPSGEWQTCAFGNCMILSHSGYSAKNIVDADYLGSIQTEWITVPEQYATWEATLQIHVFNIVTTTRFGQTIETVGSEVIGSGPTVTVRFEYSDPSTTEPAELKGTWWGYTTEDDRTAYLGTQQAETYDCAIYVPSSHPIASGKTINAVRFKLGAENVSNVMVWIAETSRPTDVSKAVRVESVANPVKGGVNVVKLSTPYPVGSKNIYVGYSFTITDLKTEGDNYPISICNVYEPNGMWLRTTSTKNWSDLSGSYGDLNMQLLLEGEFYENAVSFGSTDLGDYTAAIGGTVSVYLPITNIGTAPITSIDYTISTNGGRGERGSFDISAAPIPFGKSRTLTLNVEGDQTVGLTTKAITANKVNGVKNEADAAQAKFSLITVGKIVERGIAVEEFTGTQCGWCPRGIAGMEKLREKYGNKFVGAAIHGFPANGGNTNLDAMYLSNWSLRYANIFSGSAPSCQLNRAYGEIDPYYGTGYDICRDFENEMSIPARVGITLKGEWNADSTEVIATADLEAVVDGQSYTIEYALIADSLTGTTSAWNQENYYPNNYSASDYPNNPDIAQFCAGGKYGQTTLKGWTFNDVVIATSYSGGKNLTTAPGKLSLGQTVTNSYTLHMPSDAAHSSMINAIDLSKVAVVAFVIAADGTVANAAKYYMPGKSEAPSGDVNGDGAVNVADISAVITIMAESGYDQLADVNGDGAINVADISAIISIMAGE